MTYATGYKVIPEIIDEIADGLIATGKFFNADSTWNTTVRTGDSARRVLAYAPTAGSPGGDTTLNAGASVGATTLNVASSASFNVGDVIHIGAGATAECRTVTAVASGQLTINVGLNTARNSGDTVKTLVLEL